MIGVDIAEGRAGGVDRRYRQAVSKRLCKRRQVRLYPEKAACAAERKAEPRDHFVKYQHDVVLLGDDARST